MSAEEKIRLDKLEVQFHDIHETLRLVKGAIMGDLKNGDSKGILENIRALQQDSVETRTAIAKIAKEHGKINDLCEKLEETNNKIDCLNKDFESLSKYKWVVYGFFLAIGWLISNIVDIATIIKTLFISKP